MKELSIEQKAKAYDEAIERARVWRDKSGMPRDKQGILDDIFPELKESEDERIRKELIGFIYDVYNKGSLVLSDEYKDKWLAWLEKQGEQKPSDKVEAKFKVGDWILIDKLCQITSISNNGNYVVQYLDDKETHILSKNFCDSHFHVWTIQDAKDGDVLSYREGQWCFIYKGIVTEDTFKYYALLSEKGITVNDAAFSLLSSCITPATKEQREQLLKAIANAGFMWDAEKKELKEIKDSCC